MNVIDAAELRRDLLGAVLVDHVAVGHLDRGRVHEVDLVLALARFALRELDGHARAVDRRCGSSRIRYSSRVVWRMW